MANMKIDSKNIFISDAYTNARPGTTVFSSDDRFDQLLATLNSCSIIKDSVHIVSEGSILNEQQERILKEQCILLTHEEDVEVNEYTKDKQLGAMILLKKALEKILVAEDSNVFMIPARYFLVKGFKLSLFKDDIVIKKPWHDSNRGFWYGSCLIKISGKSIPIFIDILEETIEILKSGSAVDSECAMYQAFVKKNIKPTEIESVYCGGYVGLSGELTIH